MDYQNLPVQKIYSPKGVRVLFEKSVKTENNNIDTIFQLKNKYKNLIEMWYASFFVLAIKKKFRKEYYIGSSDSPDIYLITKDEKNREGFPVEIMQLFNYNQKEFDDNYKKLVDEVFRKKGDKNYGKSSLLLVSRLSSKKFNVSEFIKLLNQKNWFFEKYGWECLEKTIKIGHFLKHIHAVILTILIKWIIISKMIEKYFFSDLPLKLY